MIKCNNSELEEQYNKLYAQKNNGYAPVEDSTNNENSMYFQSVETAGADVSVRKAIIEWKEKGTESKYFKKWSNNAPLVKTNEANTYSFVTGEKVVVESYHGTNQEFNYFDSNKKGSVTNAQSAKAGYWSVADEQTANSYADLASTEQPVAELQKELENAERKGDWNKFNELIRQIKEVQFALLDKEPFEGGAKTYKLFVKFENPFVINANGHTFIEIKNQLNMAISDAKENGNDGVIITNLKDKPLLGEYDEQTSETYYLAFDNTQIKSVNNQGTFDSKNPNIYYQKNEDVLYRNNGESVDVEYYNNTDIREVTPLEIEKLNVENKQTKDISKADIKNVIFDDKEKINIVNTISGINANLSKSSIEKMISTLFSVKNKKDLKLEKEIISNIEVIFKNAIPILKHNEVKNANLYNKRIMHRFALPIKIGNDEFLTMVSVKERTDAKESNIEEFTVYDLQSTNRKITDSKSQDETSSSRSQLSTYSITDLEDFIKSSPSSTHIRLRTFVF